MQIYKVINNEKIKEKLYEEFWNSQPGYWAVDKALKEFCCKTGVEWTSRNNSLPSNNGAGGEWRVVDQKKYDSWKQEYTLWKIGQITWCSP